jgi:hypothetical protein
MPFRSRRVRSRRVRRASGSRRTKRAGRTNSGGVSFAAKLGAFMLESVQGKIVFSMEDGFTSKHPQVFGVLPYLHMNFSERTFRNDLNNSGNVRRGSLSRMCNKHKLEQKLHKVKFSCKTQPSACIQSLDRGLVDSINNRWNIRQNGQRHVRDILRYQRQQVDAGIIPATSVAWGKGL